MTTNDPKELVRRFYEIFCSGDIDALDQIIDANYLDHRPNPQQAPGIEGVKHKIVNARAPFTEIQCAIDDQITEGKKVVTRSTWLFIDTTGKQATMTEISIMRVIDNKIVEDWAEADTFGLMKQLGWL